MPDIANGDTITVRQLLDMTAGVFSYTEDDTFVTNYFANPQMPFTAEDALAIVRAHEPDFAPGPSTHYSDSNYVLLELIAEKVTGEPLGDTIQSQILDKVGLDATSYPTTDAMPDPFSHGYLAQPFGGPRDVTLGNPGVAGGAGAMISSLEDLHKWAVALGTGALLPKSLQQERLEDPPAREHAEAHDRVRHGDHQPQRVPRPRRRDPRLRHRDVLPAQGEGHDRGRVEQRQRVGAERAVDVHRHRLVPVPGAVPEGPVTAPLEAGAAYAMAASSVSTDGAK